MKSSTTSDFWQAYRALPPDARIAARKAYKLGSKIPVTARFNFKRKATIGVRVSGRAIARWDANTKELFTGFGSGRTMNTNGFWGKNENEIDATQDQGAQIKCVCDV